jgi:hypothetical protein
MQPSANSLTAMHRSNRHLLASLLSLFFLLSLAPAWAQEGEYIIVSGGPAARQWEDLRKPGEQHDRWWANFIAAAMTRVKDLRTREPNLPITWLVYRDAYLRRSAADQKPYTSWIQEKQAKYNLKVVWFSSGGEVINYINSGVNRWRTKITGFEYFGHSNKFCFMFDYSSAIYGASSAWLHQNDLSRIHSGAFAPNAFCQSWGCHTGESMSAVWKKVTGVWMVGAYGKTDYSNGHLDGWKVKLGDGAHWCVKG